MNLTETDIQIIAKIIIVLSLSIASLIDLQKHKVHMSLIIITGIAGILIKIYTGNLVNPENILLLLPGLVCLVLAKVTKQAIGYGDGFLIMALSTLMNIRMELSWLLASFTIAGICGLVLLLLFKKSKKYELPFVPFMLGGYGMLLLL